MATTLPHVRLVASGTLGLLGGKEIWSCGLKVGLADPGNLNVLVAPVTSDLVQLSNVGLLGWKALLGNQVEGSLFSSDINLTSCKASAVASNNKDDPAVPSVQDDAATADRGTAGFNSLPYQVSLAVTFRGSTFKRGGAAYGRVFLPVPAGMAELTNGCMTPAQAVKFARQVGHLLDFINSIGTGTAGSQLTSGKVAMVANISTSEAAAGVRWQNVSSVTCDTRPDTVKSRANKLSGAGVASIPLPVPA